MAKNKPAVDEVQDAAPMAPIDPPAVTTEPEVVQEPPVLNQYVVTLQCPTPLQFHTLTVEAVNEAEAQAKFFEANNISGSSHDIKIQRTN